MKREVPVSVDEYLAQVSPVARTALLKLRAIIREVLPDAQEVISYGIPTFKFNKTMVAYAAFKNHCSFFPGHTVAEFKDALKGYKTSKGTIQFTPDKPLPASLVKAIVKARLAESLNS